MLDQIRLFITYLPWIFFKFVYKLNFLTVVIILSDFIKSFKIL